MAGRDFVLIIYIIYIIKVAIKDGANSHIVLQPGAAQETSGPPLGPKAGPQETNEYSLNYH